MKYDIILTQQLTSSYTLDIIDGDGNAIDLTGYEFQLDCKPDPKAVLLFFSLSSADSTIVKDTSINNRIELLFTHEVTKNLNFTKGVYDILAFKPDKSDVMLICTGSVSLRNVVTQIKEPEAA
jgi:hypothetical protein